jgi:hypothetical protein
LPSWAENAVICPFRAAGSLLQQPELVAGVLHQRTLLGGGEVDAEAVRLDEQVEDSDDGDGEEGDERGVGAGGEAALECSVYRRGFVAHRHLLDSRERQVRNRNTAVNAKK